jgi:hypothetical protein
MDAGHLPGIAHALQALHQVIHGIPVLGEDQKLLVAELRVLNNFPEAVELGLLSSLVDLLCQTQQLLDMDLLGLEVGQGHCGSSTHSFLFHQLPLLSTVHNGFLFTGPVFFQIQEAESPLLSL